MKANFAIFDTETIGLSPKYIYDLGVIICDRHGAAIDSGRWIIREVITRGDLMTGAYYSRKVFDTYIPMLADDGIGLSDFATCRNEFNAMMKQHNVQTVCAYNIAFDRGAVSVTMNLAGLSGHFLERKMHYCDLWLASCMTICQSKNYRKFCETSGRISKAGNYQTSAETVYAYLTNNPTYEEPHTALEDCDIERHIFAKIMQRKRKFPRNVLHSMPWKLAQKET